MFHPRQEKLGRYAEGSLLASGPAICARRGQGSLATGLHSSRPLLDKPNAAGDMATVPYHEARENDGLLNESAGASEKGEAAKSWHNLKNVDIKCSSEVGDEGAWRAEQTAHRGDLKLETRRLRNDYWRDERISLHYLFRLLKHSYFASSTAIMVALSAGALLLTLRILLSVTSSSATPLPAPVAQTGSPEAGAATGYWVSSIKRQGQAAFNDNPSGYKVFRNVKDYGAKGDGSTDDTQAINNAIEDGSRCGINCDSSTTTPAIVYFPPGTYIVSKPIIQYYYTQFIGDANELPTLKAAPSFKGMAVIDADPYIDGGNGANWYTNQNNFYRQVRNFVIDITEVPLGQDTATSGIHWQVGQATSLQNIRFEMAKGGEGNKQKGIFMDNGSGGLMTDLVFNGGDQCAFFGNQQFTTRNLTFNSCNTAIFMNWNWLWTFKSISINDCKLGLDMAMQPTNQTVGSVVLIDSVFKNTPIGVNTSFSENSIPAAGGTLVLDNVDFTGSKVAIQDYTGKEILAGGKLVKAWAQGNGLAAGGTQGRVQGDISGAPEKPASLLGENGFFERAKPQYENLPVESFVSLKSAGAKGDGKTDDTDAIQKAIDGLQEGQVLYVDHGAYLVTKTITIPAEKNIKITGEIWPLFMVTGEFFSNMDDPKPAFQVGKQSGDKGTFEMSDCIITTQGPAPGAILMEWNINAEQGAAGLWDTHFRIAGFAGTQLQSSDCKKNPNATHGADEKCIGSFMQLHITKNANGYFENVWLWTADHELDQGDHGQIDIYNGRGMLVESQGPVWLWGTASEHSQLCQYQFQGAKDIFYGAIQTETPYFQPNPDASVPFKTNEKYFDPDFSKCTTEGCKSAWAVRIIDSSSIWSYGSGTYSFFRNYDQKCVSDQNCQENIIQVDGSTNVNLFGVSTKASVNMITQNGQGVAKDEDNRSNFCATLAIFAQG
ncbi:glycoside hydrolase family 55 protein [Zopfia rhizophila CBS 207.26]|uniref:Glycoside hydrolase family 55 protein n=1 Tax=Zopfia rhizophila CBS 207.26 TaxID=1314779 RepID=A0A6A6EUR1_9PEZI|nr:glycoside hydrolase family 55 protein [Zopfia rhizophila CBS 207.26]